MLKTDSYSSFTFAKILAMKKILCLTVITAFSVKISAQATHSCCSPQSSVQAFASLAGNEQFRNAHEAPLPIAYAAMGKMISFPTADGKTGSAYLIPAKKTTSNYIFLFHEWWGLNDWMKKQADMFADSIPDANILAIDLYDGQVATTSEEAGKLVQSNDITRSKEIIDGALKYAGKDAKIATVGWCFGGGWSMQGALLAGNNEKGCVMYYGMPETDLNKLKALNSDVLFIWADKDQWINEKVKNDFVKNMGDAGKKLTVKEYDADHAFANPSNPHYNSEATSDAQKLTLNYLRKVLGS